MKKFLFLFCFSVSTILYSQIGINTANPQGTLDITASSSVTPANNDGLLIPRIDAFPTINPGAGQNSILVYLNLDTGAGSPFGVNPPGFYYWSFPQLRWIGLDSSALSWSLNGNSATIDGTNFIGTTDNVPLNFRINNQKAGRVNTTHTFFGYQAGNSNTENFNVGIGDNAFYTNTTGYHNVAIGSNALYKNSTGVENIAVGSSALHENTTSSGNVAIGYEAMYLNTEYGENVAVGFQALRSNIEDSNTAVGYQSLYANTLGYSNTAMGRESLRNSTTGSGNTALGRESLRMNTTGANNSAFGNNSMRNNTTGNENTTGGDLSLFSNETGSSNSAYGINSLFHNLSGNVNTAIGKETLYNNTTGNNNVALGFATLYSNTSGDQNIAIGMESSRDNISGAGNIAIGLEASRINASGNNNVAVGNFALYSNVSGSNNTALGHQADVSNGNITNSTALGNGAVVDQSNKVRIGNDNVTIIEGFVAMTIASDRRYKEEIVTIPLGLDFINQLHPVEYIKKTNSEKTKEWGLIAQELKETLDKANYKNAAIISSDKSKNEFLSIRYNDLFAPIIKSIQELSESKKKSEELQKTITAQEIKITELSNKLELLEKKLNGLISFSK
ncbi:endosialidase-like protein [Flavobacterium araucananum]|uniref:tail fiber domain-containing protein n=2 Tax=Flavobacterium araucananum TaxID=946678 RepID=UPI000D6ACCA2|nr:tail fiber domain-containing protein [Flavobacterium araucananum]PWJ96760.1 endosialidase-like protein [Flavobacterium araucananum]